MWKGDLSITQGEKKLADVIKQPLLATEPEPGTDQEEEKKEKERKTSVLDSKPNWKENSFSAAAAADGLDSISAEILDEENFRKSGEIQFWYKKCFSEERNQLNYCISFR